MLRKKNCKNCNILYLSGDSLDDRYRNLCCKCQYELIVVADMNKIHGINSYKSDILKKDL